ncbi:unnamed protein product [marine sediment metagenome]|uniref:Zinc-ribbon domain-containing protein n=1 Tax=marine sediment metagenome TaxID=412755 RepID=X1GSY5_9ZZZZ
MFMKKSEKEKGFIPCPICGGLNPRGMKYCYYCGTCVMCGD